MTNQIHPQVSPHQDSASDIVQSLLESNTQRYHRLHRSGAHDWQARFKNRIIQDRRSSTAARGRILICELDLLPIFSEFTIDMTRNATVVD